MSITLTFDDFEEFKPFTISNTNRCIDRVKPQLIEDFIPSSSKVYQHTQIQILDSLVSTTFKDELLNIATLKKIREKYVCERNKILDNPFKYFNPFYKKRLTDIDTKLDDIENRLYQLDTENHIKEHELKHLILAAEEKLKEYSHLLKS